MTQYAIYFHQQWVGDHSEEWFLGRVEPSTAVVADGPYTETTEQLGGITIIEVETLEDARMWAAKVAEGCGWPQEVRVIR